MAFPFALSTQVLVKSSPALATGTVLSTVTVTASVAVQPEPVLVAVTVYVVVDDGLATGLEILAADKSVVGLHE